MTARILLTMAAAIAVGAVAGCSTAGTPSSNTQAPSAAAPSNTSAPTMPASSSATPPAMAEKVLFKTGSSHQTLTAPMNTPLEITFNPSTMGCSANIEFTSGSFAKTSAAKENVTYSTDGLAPGTYQWKCSMNKCCYGTLVVEDPALKKVLFNTKEGSHQTLTAPANTPLGITFDPSKMDCSAKIAFTSGSFTKTSAAGQNVMYHTDGLPAGTYQWKCNMKKCCYGKLVVK